VAYTGKLTATAILLYNEKQRRKAETLVHRMVKRAVEMEGTVTVSGSTLRLELECDADRIQGEHGVGLVKRDYLPHELGETTVDTMRQVSKKNREKNAHAANAIYSNTK
jgi:D-lactate dehydrogenase (cytochrome)